MPAALRRNWPPRLPRSLKGQVLLALAGALLLAQAISTILLYRAQSAYRDEQLVHALALRVSLGMRRADNPLPPPVGLPDGPPPGPGPNQRVADDQRGPPPDLLMHGPRTERVPSFTPLTGDEARPDMQERLRHILAEQDGSIGNVLLVERAIAQDPLMQKRDPQAKPLIKRKGLHPTAILVAAVHRTGDSAWFVARVKVPPRDPWLMVTLIAQTVLIYATLVGAMALILRRIARPLAALTDRVEHFAETREGSGQLSPQGPHDVRRLIEAHNAMEDRIIALLNEKNVMLGAIGHDLKTPLAALRVRIECVDDDNERLKMAQTIEDIVRTLDDILSLARVGQPSDPLESSELSALVASVVEEYEDMGEPVSLEDTTRMVLPLRATWLRRALRNLIGNALRYGQEASVTTRRESIQGRDWATIIITDRGKGIPGTEIERMFQPFTRGEPSRNSGTGGAGLGLTLARAIAVQHGGRLTLANIVDADGTPTGLEATLRLPLLPPTA
ncbi:two-component sensor histidine kinase [Novosphingobium sp. FSY-8]|uniref:histidine kinase n=2 Tax=Novosphingobium ovatum TaxID=1908523 RepID=A0ABW9XGB6_9SPHN|nr:two-component sensor histidine kinase [Novosphingobium ovatum]